MLTITLINKSHIKLKVIQIYKVGVFKKLSFSY